MKMPGNIYERLTPEERFHAFIEATARKDEEEVDRLNDTCPMKTYEMDDYVYIKAKISAIVLTLATQCDATMEMQDAALAMAILIFGNAKHHAKAYDALMVLVRRYRTRMQGFDQFCQAIGIAPETLRQAVGCQNSRVAEMVLQYAGDDPDCEPTPEEVASETEQLMQCWRAPSGQ